MTAKKTTRKPTKAKTVKPAKPKVDRAEALQMYAKWQAACLSILDRLRDDAYDVLEALNDESHPLQRHLCECSIRELVSALSEAACQAMGCTPSYAPCPVPIPRPLTDAA